MNHHNREPTEEEWEGDLKTYIIGFALSLLFTGTAFYSIFTKWVDGPELIITLAILQFITQVIFFLHLGKESKTSWNLTIFWFMLLVIIIIVLGTLWIMHGLQVRTMPWMQ